MGFFTVLSTANKTTELDYIKAVFTLVSTISKSTFTDAWINSRWNALVTDVQELDDSDQIPSQVLIQYERVFQSLMPNHKSKASDLVYNQRLATLAGFSSINWIILQLRAPHVSGLTAVCEFVARYKTVTHTKLSSWFPHRS